MPGGHNFNLSRLPYRPADFADWREGILANLFPTHALGSLHARDLAPGSPATNPAAGGVSSFDPLPPFHGCNNV